MAIVLCLVGIMAPPVSAQDGGLTLTPATLTLSLAAGKSEQVAEFSLSNKYQAPITLHFAFEPRMGSTSNLDPNKYIKVDQNDVTLGAGETVRQKVTLTDNTNLSPGSQLADLVITQNTASSANVGVVPSIRMPLILVKEDGAVNAVTLAAFSAPRFSITTPTSLGVTVHNSGNMIAIPRGFITITGPTGTVIGKGVLNTSSQAISPGGNLALQTPLHKLEHAFWPGVYRTNISYGLGGGQTASTASSWFLFVAWWHIVTILLLGIAVRYTVKQVLPVRYKRYKKPHASHLFKKLLLIGRKI